MVDVDDAALGRARTLGRTDGLVKVIADRRSGTVLGVGIVGPMASELIAEGTLAVEMGAHFQATSGPALERPGDLAAVITNLERGDVLFIDFTRNIANECSGTVILDHIVVDDG